jgi:hypothetical protein
MGSPAAFKPNKPNEIYGNYKGSQKKLLNEFKKTKSEKGELEGLRSVRKKYNIKPQYTYPREAGLLAKEKKEQEEKNKKDAGFKLGKTSLLGK